MTRETKIGLLVGLAFIIVIGILLSDQLMRSTEPAPAPRAEVADNVRKGTTTPASHNKLAPAVSSHDPSPENAVPTREEVTHQAPPVTFVNVGPGTQGGTGTVIVGGNEGNHVVQSGNSAGQIATPPVVRREGMSYRETPPTAGGGRTIAEVAAGMGETLIGPDGQPIRATSPPVVPNTGGANRGGPNVGGHEARPAVAGGMKQYKADVGDSLSKIALKQMGANTKANRDAIVKANPSLAADPNKIIIGVTYNIPAAVAPAVAGGNIVTPAPPAPTPVPAPRSAPVPAVENVYVVQPGDSLTRIAKDHLGDLSTMAAIKELNKEAVKNWDLIPVGTKLKMPSKPLASAQ